MHGTDRRAEDDCCEDHKCQTGRHDDRAMLNVTTVDPKYKTEGDRASDQASIADKEDFLPCDA